MKEKLKRSEFLETGGEYTAEELEEIVLEQDAERKLCLVGERLLKGRTMTKKRCLAYAKEVGRRLSAPLILKNNHLELLEFNETTQKFKVSDHSKIRFVLLERLLEWDGSEKKIPVVRFAESGEKLSPENLFNHS